MSKMVIELNLDFDTGHFEYDQGPANTGAHRRTPLWDECDVPMGDGVKVELDWDEAAQPAPDFEVDQRVS